MGLRIRALEDSAAGAWDRFVRDMPQGTFFHLSPWAKVLGAAFGHASHFAYAEQDGAIAGVLPLMRMKTALFGDSLVSSPFCVYGGPLAASAEARRALEEHAIGVMRANRVPYLEFRELHPPVPEPGEEPWPTRPPLYFTFRRPITGDVDKDLKAIPGKQRYTVRKAIEKGLTSTVHRDVAAHWKMYAVSVRNLGTPVVPQRYFRLLAEAFPDALDVVTVEHEGEKLAGMLNFYFRDEALPYYGGAMPGANRSGASAFMFWEVLRRAAQDRGSRLYDFGRSKLGSGNYDFKKNWGFEATPLVHRYQLGEGASAPENNPNNPKYKAMIAVWKRLPQPVANLLGPHVVRGLG
jgi:FemAB-related protein (PEP-CTERM system-associated)